MPNNRIPHPTTTILAGVLDFAALDEPTLEALAQVAVRRAYGGNQTVFFEGEPGVGLYVVESGWFKAVKISADGREQVIHFLGPGETFNALSVFTELPNQATVVAMESSVTWLIPRQAMLQMLDTHPSLARAMIQNLATRVRHLVALVEDLSLHTVEARLARMLLKSGSDGAVQRQRWATQSEMAARLGTVPDVVSRSLRKLAADGLIRVSRHEIQILDVDGLKEKAMLE